MQQKSEKIKNLFGEPLHLPRYKDSASPKYIANLSHKDGS